MEIGFHLKLNVIDESFLSFSWELIVLMLFIIWEYCLIVGELKRQDSQLLLCGSANFQVVW